MKSIEKVGRTVDDAITEALIELGASTDEVDIEVISKGSKGLLGFGAKAAKVRITLKETAAEELHEVKEMIPEVPKVDVKPEVQMHSEAVGDSEDTVVASKEEVERVMKNAKDFLDKLLKHMDVECTIKSEVVHGNRISISLEGKNMGIIIGKRGETLDAIQYLVNIVANKERKEYIKIMLDTENYRARREETLKNLAKNIAYKVKRSRRAVSLEPMNPYERRIIHAALQSDPYVTTHSEGDEPYRKVVVTLKK